MMVLLSVAAALGIFSAGIAHAKGRSSLGWGACGLLFGVVTVPYLLLTRSQGEGRDWHPDRFGFPGRGSPCPHCGAWNDIEAVVCRHCRKYLPDYLEGERNAATAGESGGDDTPVAAAVALEEASRDPAFGALDDAFARIAVGEPRSSGDGAEPEEREEPEAGIGAAAADGWSAGMGRASGPEAEDRIDAIPRFLSEDRREGTAGFGLEGWWGRLLALGLLSVVAIGFAMFSAPRFPDLSPPVAPVAQPAPNERAGAAGDGMNPDAADKAEAAPPPAEARGPDLAPGGSPSPAPTMVPPAPVAARDTREPDLGTSLPSRTEKIVAPPPPPRRPSRGPGHDDFADTVRRALADHGRSSPPRAEGSTEREAGISAVGEIVALVQQRLRERGYDPGGVDGRAGPKTQAAIRAFQRALGHQADGQINQALLQALGIVGKAIQAFHDDGSPTASR